jgi:hypothetical protein
VGVAGVTKKKPFTDADAAFTRLSSALGEYLEAQGWSALVVGRPRIQQQPGAREFNYEFVMDFTGGKKKDRS